MVKTVCPEKEYKTLLDEELIKGFPYDTKIVYKLTINPDDRHQYFNLVSRYKKVKASLCEVLDKYSDVGIGYCLYTDISLPRESYGDHFPRVHFHGIITFDSPIAVLKFLMHIYHQLWQMAHISLNHIDDIGDWYLYCRKTKKLTGGQVISNRYWEEIAKLWVPRPKEKKSVDPLSPGNCGGKAPQGPGVERSGTDGGPAQLRYFSKKKGRRKMI